MPTTFMHIADVHLGYQQYGLQERFDDFSRAFLNLVDEALHREVAFVLLAGDLFEKRTVDPLAMRVAIEGFQRLREAQIPVLAVEGNHEKAYYRDQYSWMEFLDGLGYLRLLSPRFDEGRAVLTPHGDDGGAYVDLPLPSEEGGGVVRVYGLKYYGASINRALEAFGQALPQVDADDVRYTILMLHAGLEGQLAHTGRLTYNALAPLRDAVDYVALGHIHKPYEVEDWIYNPGSPETCSMDEEAWPRRGYYWVTLRLDEVPPHRAARLPARRRAFHRFNVEVDALTSPVAVYDRVRALTQENGDKVSRSDRPVVEVTLDGVLPFDRYDLDLGYVERLVDEAWGPLVTRVRNQTTPADFQVNVTEDVSRPELEHAVVRDLLARDARYRPAAEDWATGALELKRLVLEGSAPETIFQHLRALCDELPGAPEV
jgi:DNA repair exonuclease SbcCD nuclease subunit